MARFKVEQQNGEGPRIVDTDLAVDIWQERTEFGSEGHVSVNTGRHDVHETLFRTAGGHYWIMTTEHKCNDALGKARIIEWSEAAEWLLLNCHDLPEELSGLANGMLQ